MIPVRCNCESSEDRSQGKGANRLSAGGRSNELLIVAPLPVNQPLNMRLVVSNSLSRDLKPLSIMSYEITDNNMYYVAAAGKRTDSSGPALV